MLLLLFGALQENYLGLITPKIIVVSDTGIILFVVSYYVLLIESGSLFIPVPLSKNWHLTQRQAKLLLWHTVMIQPTAVAMIFQGCTRTHRLCKKTEASKATVQQVSGDIVKR